MPPTPFDCGCWGVCAYRVLAGVRRPVCCCVVGVASRQVIKDGSTMVVRNHDNLHAALSACCEVIGLSVLPNGSVRS